MELWDERERVGALVQAAGRAARLADRLAAAGDEPNQRTRRAFLSAAEWVGDTAQAVLDHSITVDATRLLALEKDLERVRKETRRVESGRPPEPHPFASLAEDARSARKQMTHFFRSAPRPSEAKLAKQRAELLQFMKELDAEYGPPSEEDRQAARELWDRLDQELFR